MAYDRFITYGDGDDTILITDCKRLTFSLGINHGCLGGELIIPRRRDEAFDMDIGDVVRARVDADGDPVYMGTVTRRERSLERDEHVYEVGGAWRAIAGALVQADDSWTGQTVDAIVGDLWTNEIDGLSALIVSANVVGGSTTIAEFAVTAGRPLADYLAALAILAGDDGGIYSYGVDAAGEFYFQAVSADAGDIQATIKAGDLTAANVAVTAREVVSQERPSALVLVGDDNAGTGFRTKKTYAVSGGKRLPYLIRVPGVIVEADLTKFSGAWQDKYAGSDIVVDGLLGVATGATPTIPMPWAGQIDYQDADADSIETTFFSAAEVAFDEWPNVRVSLGLEGAGDRIAITDPYAPETLDQDIGTAAYDEAMTWPDATDATTPADDELREINQDIFEDMLAEAGGATGTGLDRGTVVGTPEHSGAGTFNSGAETGSTVTTTLKAANGGTAFSTGDVVVYYRTLDSAGAQIAVNASTAAVIRTDGDVETWGDQGEGYTILDGDVSFQVGVRVRTAPSTYKFYPDESGGVVSWGDAPVHPVIEPVNGAAVPQWQFVWNEI